MGKIPPDADDPTPRVQQLETQRPSDAATGARNQHQAPSQIIIGVGHEKVLSRKVRRFSEPQRCKGPGLPNDNPG